MFFTTVGPISLKFEALWPSGGVVETHIIRTGPAEFDVSLDAFESIVEQIVGFLHAAKAYDHYMRSH